MHLFFYPIADSYWFVAVVAAALLAIVVLVGPGRDRVSLGRRITLALIRAGVVLLLLLGMLRPTLVYTTTHKEKATLVLLVDQSRSMVVRDCLNNKTRWESLLATLEESVPALRNLGRDFEIKAYTFDADIHPTEVKEGRLTLPVSPIGQETAIGADLDDVLNQENGKRLLGIVILTDGRQQAVAPRDASAQDIAAKLRHQSYPAYPVVFGQSRGLGGVQDVAVVAFPEPPTVFVKTEMAIHGEVKISGYVNRKIPVRVLMESPDGTLKIIDQTEVTATADGQLLPVDFTYTPETAGQFKLVLEAVPQPGELVITNNRLESIVNVRKGGLHVLYIEGDLRLEQKFLRRSLDASRDIKVDAISLDPRHPETIPADLAAQLKADKYDVYILGDVDSKAFETPLTEDERATLGVEEQERRKWAMLEQLKQNVNRGKGLILLGGFHTFGPGGYGGTPLADVLPVEMDRLERQGLDDAIREDMHWPGPLQMRPTPLGLQHFALALGAGPKENAAAWDKLPPLDGANRFLKTSRQAIVLAEGDGDEAKPLLVTQLYGNGRVLAFAGDSTWRWCMRGFGSAHKRFWRQVVLWLAHKDQLEQGDVWVRLDNARFFPGNRVEFAAEAAQSPQNEPIADAEFTVEVVKPDQKRSPVVMIRKDDHVTGSFRDTQLPGDYAIEVSAKHEGKLLGTARTRFIVSQQDMELDNASADLDSMKSVAKSSGGEVIEPERLAAWLTQLAKKTEYLDVKQETKKTLWDQWPFFFAIVFCLTVEWYLRKRWGLV